MNSEFVKYSGSGGSPFGVVRAGFERLIDQPLPADPRPVPSPAAAASPIGSWGGLRERLWDPAVPIAEIDAIWVWLIERARTHGEDAMLVCAGLAVPMLARAAGKYAAVGSRHRHDIESEVLTSFLANLGRIALDRPGVWHRLRWVAYRATRRAANQQHSEAMSAGDIDCDLGPLATQARSTIAEPGHPEAVLAQAVAAGVLTAHAAELIAVSRWEGRSLTALAAERGQSLWTLHKQRRRTELRLAAWLTQRNLDLDSGHTSTVEAAAVTTLAPLARSESSPRRGRRPRQDTSTPMPSSTGHGQVAA
ncbi:hypothetical protein NONI108955_43390 [Nocardia ninae]|uniref:Uncharacterized protein n=1 Tax=Nocardia ninae NBRC 108245 TaxID=1210091 RepID=A0A511MVI0_9NOCA|nr:hypothetical protein [Nocardia ninae]GEM44177.1 hypothetical protein NN4_86960 [Nocardia ninae NBRC 108245]